MKQAEDLIDTSGAGKDDICDAHSLSVEVWGDRCKDNNSSLIALSYLYRRFGPPIWGSDSYKDLCAYYLTTEDPKIFLWLHLGGNGLFLSTGYVVKNEIIEEIHKPINEWWKAYKDWWCKQHPEFEEWEDTEENRKKASELFWNEQEDLMDKAAEEIGKFPRRRSENWRENDGLIKHVNQVLFNAMKELERPVYIRDCAINIFGRCEDSDDPAPVSKYAGLGVPIEEMDKMLEEDQYENS
jgi:hypothetical protein